MEVAEDDVSGLAGGGSRVLRGTRGRQLEDLLAAEQGCLRLAGSGPHGEALGRARTGVRRGPHLSTVSGRPIQPRQVALQDQYRSGDRGWLHPAHRRWIGGGIGHVGDGSRSARAVSGGGERGSIGWREWPAAAWLGTRRVKDRVVEFLRLSRPLNDWLRKNVGPSTLPERRR